MDHIVNRSDSGFQEFMLSREALSGDYTKIWAITGSTKCYQSVTVWNLSSVASLSEATIQKDDRIVGFLTDKKGVYYDLKQGRLSDPDLTPPDRYLAYKTTVKAGSRKGGTETEILSNLKEDHTVSVVQSTPSGFDVVSEDIPIVDPVDLDTEILELRSMFPDVDRKNFYRLENGNISATLDYHLDDCQITTFEVLLEFTEEYPVVPPRAWITEPKIDPDCPHIDGFDDYDHALISYMDPEKWDTSQTSFDAAVRIQSWLFAYCEWLNSSRWENKEINDS